MHITYLYFLCAPIILMSSINAYTINKTAEGHPAGFLLEHCPGSLKPAVISRKNLRHIKLYVTGINAKRTRVPRKRAMYNYNMVKQFAEDPSMDWSKPIILSSPGWMTKIYFPVPFPPIIEAFYRTKGYNVWLLDLFHFMVEEYPVAARAMKAVGQHVGEMLAQLSALQPKFDPKKLNIMGISLGAHTMSYIAKTYKNITGVKIGRLTAMDPSGPCFRNRDASERLDDSDADFVEVIQTNIDGLGMAAPVGHVNFFVNGGEFQPGEGYWMGCGAVCSHIRSGSIWMFSLMFPNKFIGIKCDSVQDARSRKCYDRTPMETNVVGLNVDMNKPGIYYLATRNNFPYYMGEKGLKKENDYILNQLKRMNSHDVMTI